MRNAVSRKLTARNALIKQRKFNSARIHRENIIQIVEILTVQRKRPKGNKQPVRQIITRIFDLPITTVAAARGRTFCDTKYERQYFPTLVSLTLDVYKNTRCCLHRESFLHVRDDSWKKKKNIL